MDHIEIGTELKVAFDWLRQIFHPGPMRLYQSNVALSLLAIPIRSIVVGCEV